MSDDPFKELGIDRDATPNEIKAAFRRLAKKHHPDVIGGSGERFKRILLAYERLCGYAKPVDGREPAFDYSVVVDIDRSAYRVQDLADDFRDGILTFFNVDAPEYLNLYLELSEAEAKKGGRVRLTVPLERKCRVCLGFGRLLFVRCRACGGTGIDSYQQEAFIDLPPGIENGMRQKLKVDNLYLTVIVRIQ
jgi:hypothetical protein